MKHLENLKVSTGLSISSAIIPEPYIDKVWPLSPKSHGDILLTPTDLMSVITQRCIINMWNAFGLKCGWEKLFWMILLGLYIHDKSRLRKTVLIMGLFILVGTRLIFCAGLIKNCDLWLKSQLNLQSCCSFGYRKDTTEYLHIWLIPGRRAGYQVWWFWREEWWCCTSPSWYQGGNYGDSHHLMTLTLWSGKRRKEQRGEESDLSQIRSGWWSCMPLCWQLTELACFLAWLISSLICEMLRLKLSWSFLIGCSFSSSLSASSSKSFTLAPAAWTEEREIRESGDTEQYSSFSLS